MSNSFQNLWPVFLVKHKTVYPLTPSAPAVDNHFSLGILPSPLGIRTSQSPLLCVGQCIHSPHHLSSTGPLRFLPISSQLLINSTIMMYLLSGDWGVRNGWLSFNTMVPLWCPYFAVLNENNRTTHISYWFKTEITSFTLNLYNGLVQFRGWNCPM